MDITQANVESYFQEKKKSAVEDLRDYFSAENYDEKQELDAIVFDLEDANFLTIEHPQGQKEKDDMLQADTMIYLAGN